MAAAAVPPSARLRVERREIRQWLGTTPGRLRILSVVIVVFVVAFGAIAVSALTTGTDTLRAITFDRGRAVSDASQAYVALSDGDARTAAAFLAAGVEPAQPRDQYLQDLRTASERLASLASNRAGSATEAKALQTIDDQLPLYTGLIELARANSRQGYPVGAAYLREASTRMREQILPALLVVYRSEATSLEDDYRSATSGTALAVVLASGLAAIALIALGQVWLWRRSHRVLNAGLLVATAAMVVAVTYTSSSLLIQRHRLAASRRQGSDELVVLSSAQILALRARADEALALGARGGGGTAQYFDDFQNVDTELEGAKGDGGLLADAQRLTAPTTAKSSVDDLVRAFHAYVSVHRDVKAAADQGDTHTAISQAIDAGQDAFSTLDARFSDATIEANTRFGPQVSVARQALARTRVVVLLCALLAVGFVLVGLRPRIREYR